MPASLAVVGRRCGDPADGVCRVRAARATSIIRLYLRGIAIPVWRSALATLAEVIYLLADGEGESWGLPTRFLEGQEPASAPAGVTLGLPIHSQGAPADGCR